MATRIVVLGWGGQACELASSADAAACRDAGMLYASYAKWSGPLSDALVLMFTDEYLDAVGGRGTEAAYAEAWKSLPRLCGPRGVREFTLDTPIPVG